MLNPRIATIAGIVLLGCPAGLFGGLTGGLTFKCIGDHLHSYLTVGWDTNTHTFDIDNGPNEGCKCAGSSGSVTARVKPRDVIQSHAGLKPQDVITDGPCYVCQLAAANAKSSGSGAGTGGSGPPPMAHSQPTKKRAAAVSPTGASAFAIAAPFRQFAIPSLYLGTPPQNLIPQCNSQLNPTAYLVDHIDSKVSRNNMCTGATVATISNVPTNPLQIRVTPDGKWAILTSYNNAISFINTDTDTVANVIRTDGDTFPSGLAISPDGSYALVTSYIDDNPALLVIDIANQAITGRFPLDRQYPQSVFLSPDATVAWVTYPFEDVVEVIDVMTGTVNYALSVQEPIEVLFNATGTVAYVSSASAAAVLAVDTSSYKVTHTVPTGRGASGLQLTLEGTLLIVDNYFDNSISLVDTSTLTVLKTMPVSDAPHGVAAGPLK